MSTMTAKAATTLTFVYSGSDWSYKPTPEQIAGIVPGDTYNIAVSGSGTAYFNLIINDVEDIQEINAGDEPIWYTIPMSYTVIGGLIDSNTVLLKLTAPIEPCSEDKADSDDHESGGSNDDDSRPAPPTPHQSEQNSIYNSLDSQLTKIDASTNGQATIDGKDLVNALPSATMQKIAENPNVTVFFTYIYNDAKYTTAIPAGTAIDSSLEWYGPIYMMTHFPTMWHQDANTSVPVVAPVQ